MSVALQLPGPGENKYKLSVALQQSRPPVAQLSVALPPSRPQLATQQATTDTSHQVVSVVSGNYSGP